MNSAVAIDLLLERGAMLSALEMEHEAVAMTLKLLQNAVVCGDHGNLIVQILDMSLEFCATHFAHEEAFLRRYDCAHMDSHAAAHNSLLARLQQVRTDVCDNVSLATLDAVDLMHVFRQHMEQHDRPAYAQIEPCSGHTCS